MNEMKRVLLFMTCCLLITVASTAKSNDDLRFNVGNYTIEVQVYTPEIIRILKYPKNNRPEKESFSVILKLQLLLSFTERKLPWAKKI